MAQSGFSIILLALIFIIAFLVLNAGVAALIVVLVLKNRKNNRTEAQNAQK